MVSTHYFKINKGLDPIYFKTTQGLDPVSITQIGCIWLEERRIKEENILRETFFWKIAEPLLHDEICQPFCAA